MFQGDSVQVARLGEGFVEIRFDRRGEAINKLDVRTLDEFRQAVNLVAADAGVRGVLLTSAKNVFIVGADITEFGEMFAKPAEAITAQVLANHRTLCAFEDLPVPSVAALNGYALGGGLEIALGAALRVMAAGAQVGVPEVKLGLFPGLGGTVRLARLAGAAAAADWVASGRPADAPAALAAGVVDEIAEPAALQGAALALLRRCAAGEVDWRARQQHKREPVAMPEGALRECFEAALSRVRAQSPAHQPAAVMAVEAMARGAGCPRDEALAIEAEAFGRVCKTQAAAALVQTFLDEQALKKLHRRHAAGAAPVQRAAVVGAGIMGGGIAFTSARAGVPVRLKDIAPAQLDLGVTTAARQLDRQVRDGRMAQAKADTVLAAITPQRDDAGLAAVDVAVEAVVEKLAVKHEVLAALERVLPPATLIASNTSSLRIADLAAPLARPERLVGMHFFNPVPAMPLVEIVRGPRSSEAAVATAVGYALAMKKTPIVVKDGPGFLVNRLLTAYIRGFVQLVADGADYEAVDRTMEAFGWPMGPAWLEDVVGLDTAVQVCALIAAGFPERMPPIERDVLVAMAAQGRLGQKSGAGFYRHERDAQGRPVKHPAPEAQALVATLQPGGRREFADDVIVERLMLPLLVEAVHALAEGVVGTPAELDAAMRLGVGFPAWLGGPLKYIDWLGAGEVVARCERLSALGAAYAAPGLLREMAAGGRRFHGG